MSILIVGRARPAQYVAALAREGFRSRILTTGSEALAVPQAGSVQAIVLALPLNDMADDLALIRLRTHFNNVPVIVIVREGSLQAAITALGGGAFEFLVEPVESRVFIELVQRAIWVTQQRAGSAPVPSAPPGSDTHDHIVGRSVLMQFVFKRIALVAPRDDTCVLITGESGTGKEMVARAVHRHSPRSERPFLPINIAALNPSLVESELFGHTRGAYTGADEARPGLFQLADGGTVLLDELADIPLPVQVKLLRVLEQGEVLPVGSSRPEKLNVRIISATHQDLLKKVADGSFRHDLYFRLNVFEIHLPPLRERAEDILALTEHFLSTLEPSALPLLPETNAYLTAQRWQGNARELRNALEHAVIIAHGNPLLPAHFPQPACEYRTEPSLQSSLRGWVDAFVRKCQPEAPTQMYNKLVGELEPVLLQEVVRRVAGNRWAAAEWLGIHRATVRKKIALYNQDPDEQHE